MLRLKLKSNCIKEKVKHNGTERQKDKGWEKIYETKSYFKKSHCGYIVWNKLIFKAKQIFMNKEIHYFLKLPEI